MITYRAMYKFLDDGVHAEVLDFPGVISSGRDLVGSRREKGLQMLVETSSMLSGPLNLQHDVSQSVFVGRHS